jgi:hypothetical protein
MRTKYFKIFLLAVLAILLMVSCGDDAKSENSSGNPAPPEGQTYQQSVTIDVQGTQQTVYLYDLSSKIDDVENNNSWLQVLIGTYSSGSPIIVISAEENTNTQPRSGNVTITSVSGDRVILTVTQKFVVQETGIEDLHDIPSDNPANSR